MFGSDLRHPKHLDRMADGDRDRRAAAQSIEDVSLSLVDHPG
jgi:hypothetical protein